MKIREAKIEDIGQIQFIRNSVKENRLSSPDKVTDADCLKYITQRGKGWVAEVENKIIGFAIADLIENNIWALFMHPDFENKGIGKMLHEQMMDWYFSQSKKNVWLTTAPHTRAENFYLKNGWTETSFGKEIRFEMNADEWLDFKEKNEK